MNPVYRLAVARVDITPDCPSRLAGYLKRLTQCEGVAQRWWAKEGEKMVSINGAS